MSDTQRRIVLAALPHLSRADRLIDQLQRDGHSLQGSLLIGGDASATSDRRVLVSAPDEPSVWHVADAPPPPSTPGLEATSHRWSPMLSAGERIAWVAGELSDVWRELHDQHLGGDAVLGLLPLLGNHKQDENFGRTVLEHADGFFGLFELLGEPTRR